MEKDLSDQRDLQEKLVLQISKKEGGNHQKKGGIKEGGEKKNFNLKKRCQERILLLRDAIEELTPEEGKRGLYL